MNELVEDPLSALGCCAQRQLGRELRGGKALRDGMVALSGGSFLMGSAKFYREERPQRIAAVGAFSIDVHPVTNRQFLEFVTATGYLTFSERRPERALYPEADPELLVPGSLVFTKPDKPTSLRDYRAWWSYVPGASWRCPRGPTSTLAGLEEHPVVHVTYEDALAYATWACKSLPTEAEWEFAARGGLPDADYPWGEEFAPGGRVLANTWQGRFPWESLKPDGYVGTTPVGTFPANGYGLYDVVGNVWEWTSSSFEAEPAERARSCCGAAAHDSRQRRHVVKGGSHLCAPNYCLRFRPAARQGQTLDTSTSHIGFRCVVR